MKDGKKSKFDFCEFQGGYDDFAVNRSKYTMLEALEIYRREMNLEPNQEVAIGSAWVRFHAGRDEGNEKVVGWWLEYEEHKNSCPVYVMHTPYPEDRLVRGYTLVLPEVSK